MVELLKDFPSYVAAYKATGHVNQDEYERVVMKRVNEVADQFGAINFIVKLETGMENYSLAALIDYLKISFQHIHRWNRMAIVSDQKIVRLFYDALSPLVPGKVVGYKLKDFEKAKAWVSQPVLRDENSLQQWNWKATLAAGGIGTTAMTCFSWMASKLARKNFSEPSLLGAAIHDWNPQMAKCTSQRRGWETHFALGAFWGLVYGLVKNNNRPLASALLFGCISGTSAIFLWKKILDLNPRILSTSRAPFYVQLFFAHQVFSLTAQWIFQSQAAPEFKRSEISL